MASTPSPSLSTIVHHASGRRVVYDSVTLSIIPEHERDIGTHTEVDVLLLHGMTPNGRKCWGLIDHGPDGNIPQQNSKSVAKQVRRLTDALGTETLSRSGGSAIASVRLIMPDRPGYGGSDPACEGIAEEEGAVTRNYSYVRFAQDMRRVLEHAARPDGESTDGAERRDAGPPDRRLAVLGTSSGGPCALAVRSLLTDDADAGGNARLREIYAGGFAGTILCSSDCPYGRPDCPPEVLASDRKCLNGQSVWEYVQEESGKKFRQSTKAGWITDYALERSDWGFDPGAAAVREGGDEMEFFSPAVHMYIGGARDFDTVRLCAPFLKGLIGSDAMLEVMEDQDHFYASRKPAVLAMMLSKLLCSTGPTLS